MPPTLSLEQVTGFGIFMIKAVLNGRGDEIIGLAWANLRPWPVGARDVET
jgi:pyruvate dehydrogenase (quinone)